mmetsp:Transcript_20672/g.47917  ORF Transcript_20672/g.47917 Transcript_20672/m.47917 type:complete len:280 (-) Transcript_20672:1332-2171(-)
MVAVHHRGDDLHHVDGYASRPHLGPSAQAAAEDLSGGRVRRRAGPRALHAHFARLCQHGEPGEIRLHSASLHARCGGEHRLRSLHAARLPVRHAHTPVPAAVQRRAAGLGARLTRRRRQRLGLHSFRRPARPGHVLAVNERSHDARINHGHPRAGGGPRDADRGHVVLRACDRERGDVPDSDEFNQDPVAHFVSERSDESGSPTGGCDAARELPAPHPPRACWLTRLGRHSPPAYVAWQHALQDGALRQALQNAIYPGSVRDEREQLYYDHRARLRRNG